MKLRITLKDPDGVYEGLLVAATTQVGAVPDEQNRRELVDQTREQLYEKVSRFIEFGEYLTIEFDTESNTCIVVPCQ